MPNLTRREMLAAAAGAPVLAAAPQRPSIVLFTKPVQSMGYDELGRMCKRVGLDGIDLTVRPNGHVLPERVERDLPAACEAFQKHGLTLPMITTALTSPADPSARRILATAARLKVRYFKLGYWRYGRGDVRAAFEQAREEARGLAELAREYGIEAAWHNHSGTYVGYAIWDSDNIISGLDPKWIGHYYDFAHASTEGSVGGWQVGLRLALPRLKLVAVKDYVWEKVDGAWARRTCPLGEGLVKIPDCFKMLAAANFRNVISLHMEYRTPDPVKAIAHDVSVVKAQLDKTYTS